MRVELTNYLAGCPDRCPHMRLESQTFTRNVMGKPLEVITIVTCEHLEVCKLREEHICNGAAASADATSPTSR